MPIFIYKLLIYLGFSISGNEPILIAEASLEVIAHTTWPAGTVCLYETPYTKKRSVKFDNTQTISQYEDMPLFKYGILRWLNGNVTNQDIVARIQNHHDILMRRLFIDVPRVPITPIDDRATLITSIPIIFVLTGYDDVEKREEIVLITLLETKLSKKRTFEAEGPDWIITDGHYVSSHQLFMRYISPWLHGSDETLDTLMSYHIERHNTIQASKNAPKGKAPKGKKLPAKSTKEFLKPIEPTTKVIPFKKIKEIGE